MFKLFLALCFVTTSAFAQRIEIEADLLSPSTIKKLIGDYPKLGTPASNEDFKVILQLQKTRTAQDCAQATADESTSVAAMFGGDKGILNDDEVNRMQSFLLKAYANTGVNAYIAKSIYKRPRPYLSNKEIKPCIGLESSYAYPSGHSMISRLYGRILSRVYPERAEQLMKRANEFAYNRVVGGVHHPSDVKAAFILSDYLATKMIQNENFNLLLNSL